MTTFSSVSIAVLHVLSYFHEQLTLVCLSLLWKQGGCDSVSLRCSIVHKLLSYLTLTLFCSQKFLSSWIG